MQNIWNRILIFIIVLVGISAVLSGIAIDNGKPEIIDISSLVQKIDSGEVERLEVLGDTIAVFGAEETAFEVKKEPGQSLSELLTSYGMTAEELAALNIEVKETPAALALLQSILPTFLFLIGFFVIFWFIMRQVQGANSRAMNFGQTKAREVDGKKHKVKFGDVAGAKEAKEELSEIVDFLKHPKKFIEVGAKIPKGVLLMGPPGTGKTLLARAVAGEAGAPFFHISGSEFVEMFVGVGASRVRDLFQKAKKASPCIVFIDEIDAVGRQRGAGLGGGNDEREQTLNQILVEMDGFEPNSGIIVIAATNRPDVLDPALLRPGRFDRRITLDLPSLKDRKEILDIHAKGKPLQDSVDLQRIAQRTVGFSGADLMNIMNEAAILTARENKKIITQAHLLEAIEKVMLGPERKSHIHSDDERLITAYHEAGHALVGHLLPHCDEVHKVSIVPRGQAGGYTMSLPEHDKKYKFRNEYLDDMAMALGGYAAEEIIFGDITTGPSSDLKNVTENAKRMVTRYGMSEEMGPRTYGEREEMIFLGKEMHQNKDYSEKTSEAIDGEVKRLVTTALDRAREIIKTERKELDKIVNALLKNEMIEKEEFEAIVGPAKKAPKIKVRSSN
ncbi:MAG: ATP-dependent zinc metalloprotease FtsH [bacterium]|nr:ATP-dependent zinc metalloprotease FtsH [bacterium]